MNQENVSLFSATRWVFALVILLALPACQPETALETAVPTPTPSQQPIQWAEGPYYSDCLGRTVEIPEEAPIIELSYSETPIQTQLAEADSVILGTIVEMSHTCFNQNGGAYYPDGLPYFEMLMTVDEVLQQKLELSRAELLITQVGYSPLDVATPPLALGNVVIAIVVDREMAWGNGGTRAILRPFDHIGHSLLLAQPDGTFTSADGQTNLPLADIRLQIPIESNPAEPQLVYQGTARGCGSIFVYKPNSDTALSEFLTISLPATAFALSEEPLTLALADYQDQIAVKIEFFGDRVYKFGEFPYCNDVAPVAAPQEVWVAEGGTLTVSVAGDVPEDACAGDGFATTIRLENATFRYGDQTLQLDEATFENVHVGWCVG